MRVTAREGQLALFMNIDDQGFCRSERAHLSRPLSSSSEPKFVLQKWYSRLPGVGRSSPENEEVKKLVKDGQSYVLCDGSGSCREYMHPAVIPSNVKGKPPRPSKKRKVFDL